MKMGPDLEWKGPIMMKPQSRRSFLTSGGAATAAVALTHGMPGAAWAAAAGRRLGIELYSVKAGLAKDVPGTLAALAAIGYKFVETGVQSTIPAKDLRAALDAAGLSCPSAHLRFTTDDPGPLLDEAHTLGAQYAVSSVLLTVNSPFGGKKVPGAGNFLQAINGLSVDDFKQIAALANNIAAKTKAAGLQYAYHNHNFEFRVLDGGKTGYDVLLAETDPELVKFELDCGWMVAAGFSPVEYMAKNPRRYRMIHVKDFQAGTRPTAILMGPDSPKGTELGRGHIDYKPIFKAAEKAGVEYYFREQEPPIADMTEMEAARANYQYMRGI